MTFQPKMGRKIGIFSLDRKKNYKKKRVYRNLFHGKIKYGSRKGATHIYFNNSFICLIELKVLSVLN